MCQPVSPSASRALTCPPSSSQSNTLANTISAIEGSHHFAGEGCSRASCLAAETEAETGLMRTERVRLSIVGRVLPHEAGQMADRPAKLYSEPLRRPIAVCGGAIIDDHSLRL